MFWLFAGIDIGDKTDDEPANNMTLKTSVFFRPPIKSRSKVLDVSIGYPFMEPETSTMKTYSLGVMSSLVIRFGGWTV